MSQLCLTWELEIRALDTILMLAQKDTTDKLNIYWQLSITLKQWNHIIYVLLPLATTSSFFSVFVKFCPFYVKQILLFFKLPVIIINVYAISLITHTRMLTNFILYSTVFTLIFTLMRRRKNISKAKILLWPDRRLSSTKESRFAISYQITS